MRFNEVDGYVRKCPRVVNAGTWPGLRHFVRHNSEPIAVQRFLLLEGSLENLKHFTHRKCANRWAADRVHRRREYAVNQLRLGAAVHALDHVARRLCNNEIFTYYMKLSYRFVEKENIPKKKFVSIISVKKWRSGISEKFNELQPGKKNSYVDNLCPFIRWYVDERTSKQTHEKMCKLFPTFEKFIRENKGESGLMRA